MYHVRATPLTNFFFVRLQVLLDCGAVQADALTVDRLASLEKVCCKLYDMIQSVVLVVMLI